MGFEPIRRLNTAHVLPLHQEHHNLLQNWCDKWDSNPQHSDFKSDTSACWVTVAYLIKKLVAEYRLARSLLVQCFPAVSTLKV